MSHDFCGTYIKGRNKRPDKKRKYRICKKTKYDWNKAFFALACLQDGDQPGWNFDFTMI